LRHDRAGETTGTWTGADVTRSAGRDRFALDDDLDELLEHLDVRPEAIIDAASDAQGLAGVYNGGGPTSAPR